MSNAPDMSCRLFTINYSFDGTKTCSVDDLLLIIHVDYLQLDMFSFLRAFFFGFGTWSVCFVTWTIHKRIQKKKDTHLLGMIQDVEESIYNIYIERSQRSFVRWWFCQKTVWCFELEDLKRNFIWYKETWPLLKNYHFW